MRKPRFTVHLLVSSYLFLASIGLRKLPLFKGLFYRIYSKIKNKTGVITLTTNEGISLLIDLKDSIVATFLIQYGEWEPGLTKIMKEIIRPGMHVVDIGAHIGYSTTLMSKLVGPNGSVTSFEPEPYNYSLLLKNAGESKNCFLIPKGVSDVEGSFTLYLVGENFGGHSMRQKTGTSIEVRTVVLDTYLKKEPVDFIKMDIEGNEPFAMRGMTEILKQKDSKMVFEYTPELVEKSEELFNNLRSYGFTLYEIAHDSGKLIPIALLPATPMGSNSNILCLKNPATIQRICVV